VKQKGTVGQWEGRIKKTNSTWRFFFPNEEFFSTLWPIFRPHFPEWIEHDKSVGRAITLAWISLSAGGPGVRLSVGLPLPSGCEQRGRKPRDE
jgi:hypothetical protein